MPEIKRMPARFPGNPLAIVLCLLTQGYLVYPDYGVYDVVTSITWRKRFIRSLADELAKLQAQIESLQKGGSLSNDDVEDIIAVATRFGDRNYWKGGLTIWQT